MEKGKLIRSGKPRDVFHEVEFLETIQLGVPKITKFAANLERRGFVFERLPVTIKEFAEVMSHG